MGRHVRETAMRRGRGATHLPRVELKERRRISAGEGKALRLQQINLPRLPCLAVDLCVYFSLVTNTVRPNVRLPCVLGIFISTSSLYGHVLTL